METPPTPQTLRTTYFGNELTVRGKLPNFPCQRPRRFYLQCHGGVLATEEAEETKMRGDGGGGRVSFGFPETPAGFYSALGHFLVFSFSSSRTHHQDRYSDSTPSACSFPARPERAGRRIRLFSLQR